jgi:hypothetical protein
MVIIDNQDKSQVKKFDKDDFYYITKIVGLKNKLIAFTLVLQDN